MIAGFHLIWTAYGWWLPNDPRGSSSHDIRVERIEELGPLHYGRKLVQPLPAELRAFYESAAAVLKHELCNSTPRSETSSARCWAKSSPANGTPAMPAP